MEQFDSCSFYSKSFLIAKVENKPVVHEVDGAPQAENLVLDREIKYSECSGAAPGVRSTV